MSSESLVSIVIPAYNHARYLDEAIRSVLIQTYHSVELIVLDDGSTDSTHEVLERYGDLFRWESQTNMGQSATLNKGWAMSRGEILGYLSADDILLPQAVTESVAALREQADASATYCDFNLIDPHSRVVRRVPTPDFNYRDMLVTVTCPPGPGAFFRRYTFARAGPWDASLRQMPDYDFWLRLGLQGRFVRIPKVLAGFRIHDASQTFSVTNEARADEPVLIVSRLLDRADLPDDVLRCRSEALSRARLVSAQLHFRAGRFGLGVRRVGDAVRLFPRTILSPSVLPMFFNALFNRLGHRIVWGARDLLERRGWPPIPGVLMKARTGVIATTVASLVFTAAVAGSWAGYPGSIAPFLLFNLSFPAMLVLGFTQPRSFVYLFFSLFLFLGFWVKFAAQMLFGHAFLEPVGLFDGSPAAWDRALIAASAAALGVIVARAAHIAWIRARPVTDRELRVPSWYQVWRARVWGVTLAAVIGLNAWNLWAAFYQIGINPRLVLPAHLNVAAAWLINLGFALWIAVLIQWEFSRGSHAPVRILFIPVMEGVVAATSTLSRFFFLLHAVPYLFTSWSRPITEPTLGGKCKAGFAVLLAVAFVLSLGFVQVERSFIYFSSAPATAPAEGNADPKVPPHPSPTAGDYVPQMIQQLPWLIVGRWVGLEGALALSSYSGTDARLFVEGMTENPRQGNSSFYQKIAHSSYRESTQFTFLTLPGIAGVLLYSGSVIVVGAGLAVVTVLMLGIEVAIRTWLPNPFLLGVSAAAMANVLCQLNFPYLALVFFIELTVTLILLWALQVFQRDLPWAK